MSLLNSFLYFVVYLLSIYYLSLKMSVCARFFISVCLPFPLGKILFFTFIPLILICFVQSFWFALFFHHCCCCCCWDFFWRFLKLDIFNWQHCQKWDLISLEKTLCLFLFVCLLLLLFVCFFVCLFYVFEVM